MNHEVKDNKLIIDGKVVYEAPGEICDTLTGKFNQETVIVIYDAYDLVPDKDIPLVLRKVEDPKLQETINQNVLCLDKNGNVVWRIENTSDLPVGHDRFIKNRPGSAGLWVYRRDAWEFRIDPQNGKILESRLGL